MDFFTKKYGKGERKHKKEEYNDSAHQENRTPPNDCGGVVSNPPVYVPSQLPIQPSMNAQICGQSRYAFWSPFTRVYGLGQ